MNIKAALGVAFAWSVVLSGGCRSAHFGTVNEDTSATQSGQFITRSLVTAGRGHRYVAYLPPGYNRTALWPVILSLHGAGECGNDGLLPSQAGLGEELRQEPARFPCIVVFPQTEFPLRYWTSDFEPVLAMLDQTLKDYHGDMRRLYLTGYSMGGAGAWFLAARHPGKFAALVPICGRIAVSPARAHDALIHRLVAAHDPYAAVAARIGQTPVWIFHGEADPIVPVTESRRIVAALKTKHGDVRLTEFPGVGHDAWTRAYAEPDLPRWLLACHLSTP